MKIKAVRTSQRVDRTLSVEVCEHRSLAFDGSLIAQVGCFEKTKKKTWGIVTTSLFQRPWANQRRPLSRRTVAVKVSIGKSGLNYVGLARLSLGERLPERNQKLRQQMRTEAVPNTMISRTLVATNLLMSHK